MQHDDPWLPRQALRLYSPILDFALRRQTLVFIVAGVMLALAVGVYTLVGKTFMPTMDEGDIIVGIEKLPSVSLEQTAELDLKIHQALMKGVPEITGVVARAGADEIGLDPMSLNQTDTFLVLKPRSEWPAGGKPALEDKIRGVLDQLPGVVSQLHAADRHARVRDDHRRARRRGDQDLRPDLKTLNDLAAQVEKAGQRNARQPGRLHRRERWRAVPACGGRSAGRRTLRSVG